eukprot:2171247-Rhodomonas_salina.3
MESPLHCADGNRSVLSGTSRMATRARLLLFRSLEVEHEIGGAQIRAVVTEPTEMARARLSQNSKILKSESRKLESVACLSTQVPGRY